MNSLLQKIAKLLVGEDMQVAFRVGPKKAQTRKLTDRDFLKMESKIGATLFGEVPEGRRREFFCLDESTWIWHEEWRDEKGINRQSTVRYEVHPNGILKVADGPRYKYIEGDELENLVKAMRLYYEMVAVQIYRRDPKTSLRVV